MVTSWREPVNDLIMYQYNIAINSNGDKKDKLTIKQKFFIYDYSSILLNYKK